MENMKWESCGFPRFFYCFYAQKHTIFYLDYVIVNDCELLFKPHQCSTRIACIRILLIIIIIYSISKPDMGVY